MLRDLPVVGRDVERHLVLDDDLADVLNAGAAGGRGRAGRVHICPPQSRRLPTRRLSAFVVASFGLKRLSHPLD